MEPITVYGCTNCTGSSLRRVEGFFRIVAGRSADMHAAPLRSLTDSNFCRRVASGRRGSCIRRALQLQSWRPHASIITWTINQRIWRDLVVAPHTDSAFSATAAHLTTCLILQSACLPAMSALSRPPLWYHPTRCASHSLINEYSCRDR